MKGRKWTLPCNWVKPKEGGPKKAPNEKIGKSIPSKESNVRKATIKLGQGNGHAQKKTIDKGD